MELHEIKIGKVYYIRRATRKELNLGIPAAGKVVSIHGNTIHLWCRFARVNFTATPEILNMDTEFNFQRGVEWDSEKSCYKIQLSRGKWALIDEDDLGIIVPFKWFCTINGYASAKADMGRGSYYILMHKYITDFEHTDHINGDKLDNRKCNLRQCTQSQNMMNTRPSHTRFKHSKYKGVSKEKNKWNARIKRRVIGYFDSEHEAAYMYNKAALEEFGEFACLNVIPESELVAIKSAGR